MRRCFIFYVFIGLLFCWTGGVSAVLAEAEVPALKGRVNDYADIISPGTEDAIAAELKALEQQESTQIAVLTVPSLKGDSIESFSIRVAEQWRIGQAEKDNGAILIVAKAERKLRIEVGYGLEGRLTDLMAGRIIRNVIVPEFKSGNFDRGIAEGVTAMIKTVRGEYSAAEKTEGPGKSVPQSAIFALVVFAFLIIQLGRIRRSAGTVAGGILAPVFGAMFFPVGGLLLLALIPMGIAAGFLFSLFGGALNAAGAGGHRRYHHGGFWIGGGGGGFSSGGFGGFSGGGGGFGGGGASGGW